MLDGTHSECAFRPARAANPAPVAEGFGSRSNSRGRVEPRLCLSEVLRAPRSVGDAVGRPPGGASLALGLPPPRTATRGGAGRGSRVPPRPSLFSVHPMGACAIMYCDRRFVITVSLIWAMLITSAFYLLTQLRLPASPATRSHGIPRCESERLNRALPALEAGCTRLQISP
jgi:hypothetical protein